MIRNPLLWLVLWVIVIGSPLGAQTPVGQASPTQSRFALVVGNGAYAVNRLVNPPNDAADMAAALQYAGFTVTLRTDLNLAGFETTLREFTTQITPGSTALFYYAGHGVQVGGQNILLPVGETINTEVDARSRGVSVDGILDRLKSARAVTALLWLDACRDNPFPGANRSGTRGLTVIQAPVDLETFIAFAAEAGATAADGTGRNGVFTAALLKQLAVPGLEINELFTQVKAEVLQATNQRQRPRTDSGLSRPLVLLDPALIARRARAASDAKAAEVATLEAQIAERQRAIANARDAAAREALLVEQNRQQALLAAQRLEAENLAQEAERRRLAAEQSRAAATQQAIDAQAQANRQRELETLVAQRRAEAERLITQTNDPVALIAAFESADQAVLDVEARYAQSWESTRAEVNRGFDQRLATLNAQTKEPWESTAEFQTRLSTERTALEAERTQVLQGRETEHGRQKQTQIAALVSARSTALNRLESQTFPVPASRLSVNAGTFNGETKRWPLTITSRDPIASFTTPLELDFSHEANLRTVYTAWDTAFKANGVSAEAAWCLERQGRAYAIRLKTLTLIRLTDNLRLTQIMPGSPIRFAARNAQGALVNVTPATLTITTHTNGTLHMEGRKLADLIAGQTFSLTTVDLRAVPLEVRYANGQNEIVTVTPRMGQSSPVSFVYRPPLLDLVFVEGGTFRMGSPNGIISDERPVRLVNLSSFKISRTEVTQSQYQTVMGTNPSAFSSGADAPNRPVEQVTWFDAVNFCNRLSVREGLVPAYSINGTNVTLNLNANGYRLPTEAEWEYAARGGRQNSNFTYAGSNTAVIVAWVKENSGSITQPVGRKPANTLGLFDMTGNVWEWVWDWYGDYSASAETNPLGPPSGYDKVLRGGGWNLEAVFGSVTRRIKDKSNLGSAAIGFRVVRP